MVQVFGLAYGFLYFHQIAFQQLSLSVNLVSRARFTRRSIDLGLYP